MVKKPDRPANRNIMIGGVILVVVIIGIFGLWQASFATNTPTSTPDPTPTDPLQAALFRASDFTGTQNSDWESFAHDFGDGVEMLLVPAGCFMMGSEDGVLDEQPIHQQCVDKPFWIDKTEVRQGDFNRLGGEQEHPSEFLNDNRPVENITWHEALAFCDLRGGTLPTEVQWGYAARGVESLIYPWGNELIADNAVYDSNAAGQTADVGSRPEGASWVGAFDMSGNVWEWTSTIYDLYPYSLDDGREDFSREEDLRVLRGGSWGLDASFLRATYRNKDDPYYWISLIGFRCARPVD